MVDWRSTHEGPVIDAHAHLFDHRRSGNLLAICEAAGLAGMNLLTIQEPERGAGLPAALLLKHHHPRRFYVFAGLDHTRRTTSGRVQAPTLHRQVDTFVEMGCDGVKLIEGKPTSRRTLPVSLDDDYYEDFFARVEELGLPLLWHVADPEEFWDPVRIPAWARRRNWGYGEGDVTKETLYREVERVLKRHPDLKVIFAHFYFLSADLERAERFLEGHPGVFLDLAPGIEMLYNISRDVERGRKFFIRHADRIVFGTDIQGRLSVREGGLRAGVVFKWLEGEGEFRLPTGTDDLLGPPEEGVIRGMGLPADVLTRIYHDNFVELVGPRPKPLEVEAAVEYCRRYARQAELLGGLSAEETQAGRVARLLTGGE